MVTLLGKLLVIVLAATGCISRTNVSDTNPDATDTVLAAWGEMGLPSTRGCVSRTRVKHWATLDAYVDACLGPHRSDAYRPSLERSAGCTASESRGVAGEHWYVLHIAPGYEGNEYLVQHELLHALTACSELGSPFDPYDAPHKNPDVWGCGGTASRDCVELKARIALKAILDAG